MDTSDKVLALMLVLLISLGCYWEHCDNVETARVSSVISYNLKNHFDTHTSKVANTGYDFHYSKNGTSLTPTYLLEDGAIIRECEIVEDQRKLAPFVKSGDEIEYTVVIEHDVNQTLNIIAAHILTSMPIASK